LLLIISDIGSVENLILSIPYLNFFHRYPLLGDAAAAGAKASAEAPKSVKKNIF
jgi:hypothetical protein